MRFDVVRASFILGSIIMKDVIQNNKFIPVLLGPEIPTLR